ncbi:unnamed protein product [Tuber melanosporum]|uniref:(Perigord truffle) hypothetical protein n=1 Tax=Tuber melanosporum (strain Mel28) TaxID=656061 RepID=D5GP49_TUBMM|nr:uncharacterized protein GSTUM_00011702001 [Tuber melanosporum]CAZ86314.1 unnamed protein product [Tuber melanosporum]
MTTSKPKPPVPSPSGSETVQNPLRPAHTGSDPFLERNSNGGGNFHVRASLDIPREFFAGSAATVGRGGVSKPTNNNGSSNAYTLPRGFAQSSRQRPLSVHSTFQSTPTHSPPSFRFDSPKTSPNSLNLDARGPSPERPSDSPKATPAASPHSRSFRVSGCSHSRSSSPSPNTEHRPPPPPPVSARPVRHEQPPPPPIAPPSGSISGDRRASMPNNGAFRRPPPSPVLQAPQDYSEPEKRTQPEHTAPPVPMRPTKPKIPSKPSIPVKPDRASSNSGLAPAASSEEHVSPFSTPPSSANNSPSRSDNESGKQPRIMSRQTTGMPTYSPPPPLHYTTMERARERNGAGVDTGILPAKAPIPPPPRISREEIRPRMKFEDSFRGQRTSLDDAGLRPDLPPRPPGGIIGGIRARVPSLRGRSYSPPRVSSELGPAPEPPTFLPPPRRGFSSVKPQTSGGQEAVASSSRISPNTSVATNSTTYSNGAEDSYGGYGPDDSDEALSDENQSALSEYPDSSQANRRHPVSKSGIRDINCRTYVRYFAVCGKYVCTTSNATNVWNMDTGQCIMSINHGESTKVTAIAFKPSVNVEDEGKQLWIGTSHGELMEVDIPSQKITNTRASAHMKKEVVQIHRCGYDLWTLDDGGKLQVWTPDVNGVPNLKNSPTTFRIPNKHTYSLVVDGMLWIGAGKNVHVYQPSSDSRVQFNVTSRPLTPNKPTAEITCGAVVNSEPDKVYFGHSDGKVSVYSRSKFTFLDVVNVSLYKINSMSGVGDYMWAGFKTGMIYVYDVRTKPWTVLKDWQSSHGPVVQVVADRTSIWKVGRLEVLSLGVDNVIRAWDGMLEDDWLEKEMQQHDVEFCSFREIKALICTWNAGANKPQDLLTREDDKVFLENVLGSVDSPDIIVFGFQELVDLEDKKITAKSLLKGGKSKKKKAADQQEHMSHQYRLWQQQLTKSIETHMPRDQPYALLHVANLVGLFTCIFVKTSERHSIRNVCASTVKRGLGGLHGNKGALVVRFLLDDSSLCFINCHLAAGQSHTISRNNDIAAILESTALPAEPSAEARTDMFVGGGDGSMILDHEICVLNGDLNYRIDMHRDSVISRERQGDLPALLERDQLLMERRRNPGFRLRAFQESQITFSPTYKYDVGTDIYDTSDKKRSPAWCDRVLYRGLGRIKQTAYRRWEVRASDHRPVSASFLIRLKTVDQELRGHVWEQCKRRYAEVREREVWEAKLDFLVNVCGYGLEEARRSLGGKEGVVEAVRSLQKSGR